jgi:hypothetical protein
MTFEELNDYFTNATLPAELRLDRASTQLNVPDRVKQLLSNMSLYPENWRHKHQLLRIKNALENPYNGPGIPRF